MTVIDLIHDLLDLGRADFLQELAADDKALVTVNRVGRGIILLDGVVGQDGQIEEPVEFGLVLEGQHGAVIDFFLLGSAGDGGVGQCAGNDQQTEGHDDSSRCSGSRFHHDSIEI